MESIFSTFAKLPRLLMLQCAPCGTKVSSARPLPQQFANLLRNLYACDETAQLHVGTMSLAQLTPFSLEELARAMSNMRKGCSPDSDGLVVEMLVHGPGIFHHCMLVHFNHTLLTGQFMEKLGPHDICNVAKKGRP